VVDFAVWRHNAPAHFDIHQSGTVSNMGVQGCMYDNLIRRNPWTAARPLSRPGTQLGDCADGKTYTFFLRKA